MTPPTLSTARLLLAPPGPADLDEAASLWADPAVTGQIGAAPLTREATWHRLLRYVGHWQAAGFGHWTVRRAADGAYLGEVGLMDSRRATEPGFEGVPEAGWAFAPAAQGRGYAAEAAAAALDWADAAGIARTLCMIAPGNAASIRLAERLGYEAAGEVRYGERTLRLFGRAAPRTRLGAGLPVSR